VRRKDDRDPSSAKDKANSCYESFCNDELGLDSLSNIKNTLNLYEQRLYIRGNYILFF